MAEEMEVIEAPASNKVAEGNEATPESPKKNAQEQASFDEGIKNFGLVMSGKLSKIKLPDTKEPKAKEDDKPDDKGSDKKAETAEEPKRDDKKLDEDVAPTDHKPEPKKKKAARPAPVVDEARVVEIAADAAARASTNVIERFEADKKKVEKSAADSFEPPSEYVDQYETFKVLAKLKPDKYKDIVPAFQKFVKEESDYIAQWKKGNPGMSWDSEAEEHSAFYDQATPNYDERDFHRAEIQKEVAETKKDIRKELMDEVQPKLDQLDELKRNETLRGLQPHVAAAARTAVGSILKAINPDYEKFAAPEELPKLKDEDPMAYDIVLEVGHDALPFVSEVTRLFKSNGQIKAQQNNPLHGYIHSYAEKMMELIKALPDEDQLRDGKKFATWSEYDKLSPANRQRYWTIGEQELIDRKLLDVQEIAAERVASENKRLESWAKRKGLTPSNANNPPRKQEDEQRPEPSKPVQTRENVASPSVGSQTPTGSNGNPPPSGQPAWMKQWETIQKGNKL